MSQPVSPSSIPDEALQLGEAHHLGAPVAAFKAPYSRSGAAYFYSQVVYMILALIMLFAAIFYSFGYHMHNALWLFYIIVALNSFNILTITRRKNKDQPIISPFERHRRIYVYQGGFISLRTMQPVVVRWEQVQQVRYIRPKSLYGRTATLTIVYSDRGTTKRVGIANTLTNADMDSLGTLLKQMYAAWKADMK